MYFVNNPVLQRELISNLRTPRAFLLMLVYQLALSAVVLLAYPRTERIDLNAGSQDIGSAQTLVDFFFLGQFAIASLMAPSFAAGAISGEKERKTYEMLLASPIQPGAIVIGKLIAALTHLVVLMIGSLPIIMLCLPLGGVAIQELLAAYLGLFAAIFLFGAISIACSSYFKRTSSSLVVSYAIILPMVVLGCVLWRSLANAGLVRLVLTTFLLPLFSLSIGVLLMFKTSRRLLYPPDVGSGGSEVTDVENDQDHAVGLVIQRDQFPDSLFAPPRRKTLLADNANPVYDKEIHAELFSQGTLMLRLVIQLSMLLAIPMMGYLLFIKPDLSGWYIGYVVIFNVLVAPVFNAGSICSERERQTLDLLLTTTITPWQILWGKLIAGFRVSFVLTMFLMWPVILSFVLNPELARNWPAMLTYFVIVLFSSFLNSLVALFCSTLFLRTSVSMVGSYMALMALYLLPLAIFFLLSTLTLVDSPDQIEMLRWIGVTSPLMTIESIPLTEVLTGTGIAEAKTGSWSLVQAYFATTTALIVLLSGGVMLLFRDRWRIAGRS
ncbi:MAG: ABC transporter permease [Pirellulaceae bacterium]|nr:ABC transporter permease [Pirellulaceae bacterium]